MLLGLLSIVTGATSVKGMALNQANAALSQAYDSVMANDYSKIPATIAPFDNKAEFDKLDEDGKSRIATLYTCLMIKNGNSYPENGKVKLNGEDVQLRKEENELTLSYFLAKNANILGKIKPSTGSKIFNRRNAIIGASLLAAALVCAGNSYYDANCPTGSYGLASTCTATAPANAVCALSTTVASGIAAMYNAILNRKKTEGAISQPSISEQEYQMHLDSTHSTKHSTECTMQPTQPTCPLNDAPVTPLKTPAAETTRPYEGTCGAPVTPTEYSFWRDSNWLDAPRAVFHLLTRGRYYTPNTSK